MEYLLVSGLNSYGIDAHKDLIITLSSERANKTNEMCQSCQIEI